MPNFRNVTSQQHSGSSSFNHRAPASRGGSSLARLSPSLPSDSDSDYDSAGQTLNHHGRNHSEHIPRPRNSFIIFRSHLVLQCKGVEMDQNQISVRAGRIWKAMSEDERLPFVEQAKKEKAEHKRLYPYYTYTPANKGTRRPRKRTTKRRAHPYRTSSKRSMAPSPAPPPSLSSSVTSPSDRASASFPPTPSIAPKIESVWDSTALTPKREQFTPADWSFVPTSEIPSLELTPDGERTKSAKLEEPTCIRLPEPPALTYGDNIFDPKSTSIPLCTSSLAHPRHDNYLQLLEPHPAYEAKFSDVFMSFTTMTALANVEMSQDFDFMPCSDAGLATDPCCLDALFANMDRQGSIPTFQEDLEFMEQYFNFDLTRTA